MAELIAGGVGIPGGGTQGGSELIGGGVGFPDGFAIPDGSVLRTFPTNPGNIGLNVGKLLGQVPAYLVEGYQERFDADGNQMVVAVYDVPWSARKAWVDQTLGYSTTLQLPGQNPVLTRTIPAQVPEPGYEHLYAQEVDSGQVAGTLAPYFIAAHDGQGNLLGSDGNVLRVGGVAPPIGPAAPVPVLAPWLAYKDPSTGGDGLIRHRVTYRPRPYEVRSDAEMLALPNTKGELERYVERQRKGAIQALPLPTGSIKWGKIAGYEAFDPTGVTGVDQQTIPDNAAYLLMPTEELLFTWHQVDSPPDDAITACTGKVNSVPFDGAKGWPTYPRGTLLCQAPQRQRYRHSNSRWYWRIMYSFLYRPTTHQALPNSKNSNFYTAVKSDGTPLYGEADFRTLFMPPAPVTYQ